jgi:hypothetical protein
MTDREIPEDEDTFSKEAVLRRGGVLPVVAGDLDEVAWLEQVEIENNRRGIPSPPEGGDKPAHGRTGRFVLADPGTAFDDIAKSLGLPQREEPEE